MEICDHCGEPRETEIALIVNYEGNPDGDEHLENLCTDCWELTVICDGCGRESFDPDFVGEFNCLACQEV